MNLKSIIAFCLICWSTTALAQKPFNQKLGDVAVIGFPDKPKVTPEGTGSVYVLTHNLNIYIAQDIHAEKSLQELMTDHINDTVYNATIKALINSVQGTLIYKKPVTVHNLEGQRFLFKANIKGLNWYCYHHMFYLNKTLIYYGVWSRDSLNADSKQVKDFFKTFKLTIAENAVQQTNADELGVKAGYYIGQWLAIVILLSIIGGIIAGIILLNRYLKRKKQRNEQSESWNNYGQ